MKLTYPACFYPCEDKDNGYTVEDTNEMLEARGLNALTSE